MITRSLIAVAVLSWASLAQAEITYPVDVPGTNGRWRVLHTNTGVIDWTPRSWPRPDGQPIEGQVPNEVWLMHSRSEPATMDGRMQRYTCSAPAIDLQASTITVTCSAPARPAGDMKVAIGNIAAARIAEAKRRLGWSAATVERHSALLSQRQSGATLADDQAAFMATYDAAATAYIDAPARVAATLAEWIDAHPGLVPDTGEAVWPPLPPDPITGSTTMPHGDD